MATTPFSAQEIENFRRQTKGTSERVHFNNAGSSLPPDMVVETVIGYLKEEATHGGYETEFTFTDQLNATYASIAKLINAGSDEIALVENASTAWWLAFNGIDFKKGDQVITSEMEYVSNLIGLSHARKTYGVEVVVIPNDEQGNFSLSALEAAISDRTRLIAVTHIPSSAGGMIPIVDIGKVARKHDILYLVDACQSVGQVPLDVDLIGCDMLAATGRKYLRAPRGTGFLYVRKAVQDQIQPQFMDGFSAPWVSETDYKTRNDARRFELFERSRALTLGLRSAVDYALQIGVDRIWMRVQYLAGVLRSRLAKIEGVTVHDFGARQCGIVTFSVEGKDSASVKNELRKKQINVSVSEASSTLIYMNKNHLTSVVRASVHYYNTEEEIEALCGAVGEMR